MAVAAPVDPFWLARRESEYHPQKIPKSTTGLDEEGARNCVALLLAGQEAGICTSASAPTRRCDSAWAWCGDSTPTTECTPLTSGLWTAKPRKSTLVVELLQIIERTLVPYGPPPPSYDEAIYDVPPDYSSTGCLAEVSNPLNSSAPPPIDRRTAPPTKDTILGDPTMSFAVDFGDTSGFQTHGKKQAKKAAKQAAQAKWSGDGNESNEAGDGEEGGGDAPGGGRGDGGSGNGDGGAGNGDGGAGDDDGDDWNAFGSGKKNKKNKKKSKKEEEEEEKRKEEEEKKKEEEAAAPYNPLSWADDTADPNPDDEWGGFTAAGKKGKKNKKGKADDGPPPPPDPPTSAFQDISLDDGAPQLDLSFGGTGAKSKDFGFASFGNNWNTGGQSWDFGIGTATTTDTKDAKSTKDSKDTKELGDNNPWSTSSFGSKAKSKKKTTFSNFDFGDLGGGEDADPDAKVDESIKDTKDSQNDDWGAFTSVNKKDKKKNKKNAIEEEPEPDPIVDVLPETQPAGNDTWDTWGTTSKKKKKKNAIEEEPEPDPVVDVVPETQAVSNNTWDTWGTTGKKKKKKNVIEDVPELDPVVDVVPETQAVSNDTADIWGTMGKKKKKKNVIEDVPESDPVVDVVPETQAVSNDTWDTWGTTSKKKKGKKGMEEEILPPPPPPAPIAPPDSGPTDEWSFGSKKDKKKNKKGAATEGSVKSDDTPAVIVAAEPEPVQDFWSASSKKDKKSKKKESIAEVGEDPAPLSVVPDASNTAADDAMGASWFSTGSSKKDKKSKKKGGIPEVEEDPAPLPVVVGASNTAADDVMGASWFSTGSSKKDKKGKKKSVIEEVKNEPVPTVDPIMVLDNDASFGADDDWDGGWTGATLKKDKKNKKKDLGSEFEEPTSVIEALPTIIDVSAPVTTDDYAWAPATTKKKDKKGRKSSVSEKSDGAAAPPPPPPAPMAPEPAKTDDWDTWGTITSSKDKKKKNKVVDVEPAVVVVPEAKSSKDAGKADDAPAVDNWGDTWGLSAKDKKKREKEAKKNAVAEVVEEPPSSALLIDSLPDGGAPVEDNSWDTWGAGTAKDKKKGKKGKQEPPPPAPTPPAQGLTPEPTPPPVPDLDDQDVNGWSTLTKSDSKSAKASTKKGTLSRTTTSTSKTGKESDTRLGLSKTKSKDKGVDLMNFGDEAMDDKPDTKEPPQKEPVKEETPAKAAKGFWSSFGSTSTPKTKTAKEKEEERAADEALLAEDLDEDEIVEILEEAPPKKGGKSKTDSKLTKVDSKGSDKSSKSSDKKKKDEAMTLVDIAEEKGDDQKADGKRADRGKAGEARLKKADGKSGKAAAAVVAVVEDKAEDKNDATDLWGSWGATSKKTAGKKPDEPKDAKKEIKQHAGANQRDALAGFAKQPEPAVVADAAASSFATAPPKTMPPTTAKSKSTPKNSIADRIKAFEPPRQEKTPVSAKDKKKPSEPTPPPPAPAPPEEDPPPPLKRPSTLTKTTSKSASASKSASTPKKKEVPAAPVEEKKTSKDSVPGSFPLDGADDDFGDMMDFAPSPQKVTRKPAKTAKAPSKPEPAIVAASMPPTPPPEPVVKQPAKKERPKIVRDSNSSWGFWGPAPKKEVKKVPKAKDDSEVSPTSPAAKKEKAPGLSRSQSTRTTKEKQKEVEKEREVASKSSSSDKEKKPATKPPVSRGMSFSTFMMGGPAASRTKASSRRSSVVAVSKPSSRRQSMDVDDIGMLSPPPDDEPELNGKAAKLMGVSAGKLPKKDTTRGKQKAKVVPDPYPIDDDDMVMINSVEDPVINAPIPQASKSSRKEVGSKSKSKRESRGVKPDDDIVMVEAGPSTDAPEFTTGPDDITFVEKPKNPPPLKRSATSAKRAAGGIGGLFGFGKPRRVSDPSNRPRPKSVYRDEEDGGRVRELERKNRRSTRVDTDAEGFTTDAAPAGGETEPEDRVDRKSKRVSRDTELRDAEERRARRREAEKVKSKDARDKRAREDEEREEKRKEDKRARRAARDEALAREEQERRDADARAAERRERRRTRDLSEEPEPAGKSSSRPKSSRRQSQMYPRSGDEDIEVRPELSDRRRSHLEKSSDGRRRHHSEKSSRRKSTIVSDYPAEPTILEHQPTDKTSSWVHSQADDPPEAPPIEPTIVDVPGPAVGAGGYNDGLSAEEDARREIRHKARRSSKYAGMTDKEVDERRRRKDQRKAEKEQLRSSEGSEGNERERDRDRDRGSHKRSTYVDSGAERVVERPSLGAVGKRGSWFKKIASL